MFFEPERTQFDLNWRMLGVHVRVHPWFWLMAAMLGWDWSQKGLAFVLLWILCVFVSILVHEFGHVFMGRLFGAHSHIVLHAFGGLAIGSSALRNRWQRIAVYLAGPAAGFLLYGLVKLLPEPDLAERHRKAVMDFLIWINLGWGILNLLPIWPLDGGQVSRDVFDWLMPERGTRIALILSMLTCGLLALNAILQWKFSDRLPFLEEIPFLNELGSPYNALLFGVLAFNSFQAYERENSRRPWDRGDSWKW